MSGWINAKIANVKSIVKFALLNRKNRKPGPVRVGFLCQYTPSWNKVEPVYDAMLADPRFEPILICVPSGITAHQLENPDSLENDAYDFYVQRGYEAVNTLIGKNEWLDLNTLELDYLFCVRPYDHHMPLCYVSGALARNMKLCVILYGMMMVEEDVMLGQDFFRNVCYYFADNDSAVAANKKLFPLSHLLGTQKTVNYGIPAMVQVLADEGKTTDAWDFCPNDFRVMWTPRWTTDPALGGTNFFNYKDWILDYAQKNQNATFLLRPHPLAFENFVKAGEMTREEVDAYKARCESLENVQIDTRNEYISTMWNSSVLIGDLSSILPEYFIMNKPLIYCTTNMTQHPTQFTQRMFEGCYVVNNQEELEQCMEMLRRGEDPMRKKRETIVRKLLRGKVETVVDEILEELVRGIKGERV